MIDQALKLCLFKTKRVYLLQIVSIYTQGGLLTANWNVKTTTNRLNLDVGELVQYNIDIAITIEACILGIGDMLHLDTR